MNRYHHERGHLLYKAGSLRPNSQRPKSDKISPSDYVAVGIPINLSGPLYGSCLIWRWALDNGGYGTLRVGDGPERAHRQAYRQTRGGIPDGSDVLHLCNRRSCVQPSHLYPGSSRENGRDRSLRFADRLESAMPMLINELNKWREAGYDVPNPAYDPKILTETKLAESREYTRQVFAWRETAFGEAIHGWDDPPVEPVMPGMAWPEPVHHCRWTIPAGDTNLCEICFESADGLRFSPRHS